MCSFNLIWRFWEAAHFPHVRILVERVLGGRQSPNFQAWLSSCWGSIWVSLLPCASNRVSGRKCYAFWQKWNSFFLFFLRMLTLRASHHVMRKPSAHGEDICSCYQHSQHNYQPAVNVCLQSYDRVGLLIITVPSLWSTPTKSKRNRGELWLKRIMQIAHLTASSLF
jgi:hypothetical protein